MSNLTSSYVQPNEVVKASDIDYGFDSQIKNVALVIKGIMDTQQDFVVNGMVQEYGDGSTMNISVAPIFGIPKETEDPFLETGITEPVAVGAGWEVDRIDTVEVKGELINTTEEQRAFIDFETKEKTLQNVYTRKEQKLIVNVKKNPNDGNVYSVAPATSEGYVKLAEIFVPAHAVSIDECTINNITTDLPETENEDWTNEKDRTYNIGYITDINRSYRVEHNIDGSHKNNVIKAKNIDIGTASTQLNGSLIPNGKTVSINGNSFDSGSAISLLIETLSNKVTDLFNSYLKNGEYKFNGELSLLKVLAGDEDLSDVLTFGTNEDGTAYIKLKDKIILKIEEDKLLTTSNYDASTGKTTNSLELATRAVTNALWDYVKDGTSSLNNRVKHLEETADPSSAINQGLSKFSFDSEHTIQLATTENIETLSGSLIIDGTVADIGYYVLVKDQEDKTLNGIYLVNEGDWTREYAEEATSMTKKLFKITMGKTNINKAFYTDKDMYTYGESEINFIESRIGFIDDSVVSKGSTYSSFLIKALIDGLLPIEKPSDPLVFIENPTPIIDPITQQPIAPAQTRAAKTGTVNIAQAGFYIIEIAGGAGGNGGSGGAGGGGGAGGTGHVVQPGDHCCGEIANIMLYLLPGDYDYILGGRGDPGSSGSNGTYTSNGTTAAGGAGGKGGTSGDGYRYKSLDSDYPYDTSSYPLGFVGQTGNSGSPGTRDSGFSNKFGGGGGSGGMGGHGGISAFFNNNSDMLKTPLLIAGGGFGGGGGCGGGGGRSASSGSATGGKGGNGPYYEHNDTKGNPGTSSNGAGGTPHIYSVMGGGTSSDMRAERLYISGGPHANSLTSYLKIWKLI